MSESENPKVVSEERKQYLLKKWGAVLKFTDKKVCNTQFILESQESWISPEAKEKYELGNKIH